jgi:hypothetical protein
VAPVPQPLKRIVRRGGNNMKKAIGLFSLLILNCFAPILPSRSGVINKFNDLDINGTYLIVNNNNSNSYVRLSDTIGYLYINSRDLIDEYEKYNIDYSICDTLKPVTTNCCKEYLWKPKKGDNILYKCKNWEKGIGYYKGNYSLIQIFKNDTLSCEVLDTVNGRIFLYFIKRK